MLYLILAVVCSSLISVMMRVSEKHIRNNVSMLAANYITCTLLAIAFSGTLQLVPAGAGRALGLGLFNGALYLGAFVLLQWNISVNGVTLPSTFMKLGVMVPTVLSMIVFHETPSVLQVIGICAAIAAIILIQGGEKKGRIGSGVGLVLLLLAGGLADAMSKVYEEIGDAALKNHFLIYTFFSALVLCMVLCVVKKQKMGVREAIFGVLVGVPNYLASRFLLLSLAEVPAVVAYPTFSVATIVLVSVAGLALFKERLSRRQLLAMCVILAALALLNV